MSPGGLTQWIYRGDGDLQARFLDRASQAFELSWAALGIEAVNDERSASAFRLWFDTVGERDSASCAHQIQASLESPAAGEGNHRIESVRRVSAKLRDGLVAARIEGCIGTQALHECACSASGRGSDHVRVPTLRKLYRQCTHRAGCAKYKHGLIPSYRQDLVNPP